MCLHKLIASQRTLAEPPCVQCARYVPMPALGDHGGPGHQGDHASRRPLPPGGGPPGGRGAEDDLVEAIGRL
eukprot:11995634-Alexandrium_andersonii.AAC.1